MKQNRPMDEPNDLDLDDREIDDLDLIPKLPDENDSYWDIFIPDDGEYEPEPEPGDFWIDLDLEELSSWLRQDVHRAAA